jgi:TRAP-type C4-dicarboxylate transport system permease small subunit
MMKVWRSIFRCLGWLEEGLLCLLLGSMVLLACLQIVLRLLHGGLVWADPMLRYMVLWSGLLGGAVATKQGKHIRIDLASHLMPPWLQAWLQVLLDLAAALVCGILTWVSIVFVRNEVGYGDTTDLFGLPAWMVYLVFPLAFGSMTCRFLAAAVKGFQSVLRRPQRREPSAVPPAATL